MIIRNTIIKSISLSATSAHFKTREKLKTSMNKFGYKGINLCGASNWGASREYQFVNVDPVSILSVQGFFSFDSFEVKQMDVGFLYLERFDGVS